LLVDPRQVGLHRRRCGQRHTAQLRPGDQRHIVGQVLAEFGAEFPQDVRLGFEQVFIHVIFTALTAAKNKIAFQVRCLFNPCCKCCFVHFVSCIHVFLSTDFTD
jgi:hypothetical protein